MLLYGFVVAAWMVFPWDNQQPAIPFASIEACRAALVEVAKVRTKLATPPACVAAGAQPK